MAAWSIVPLLWLCLSAFVVRARPDHHLEFHTLQSTADIFTFSHIQSRGCLPEDFKPPNFGTCVDDVKGTNERTHQRKIYEAYKCIVDKYEIRTPKREELPDRLMTLLKTLSSDPAWLGKQHQTLNNCLNKLREVKFPDYSSGLAEPEATFMLDCLRKQLNEDCEKCVDSRHAAELAEPAQKSHH